MEGQAPRSKCILSLSGRKGVQTQIPDSFIVFLLNHMSLSAGWPVLLMTLGSILEMLVRTMREGLRVQD